MRKVCRQPRRIGPSRGRRPCLYGVGPRHEMPGLIKSISRDEHTCPVSSPEFLATLTGSFLLSRRSRITRMDADENPYQAPQEQGQDSKPEPIMPHWARAVGALNMLASVAVVSAFWDRVEPDGTWATILFVGYMAWCVFVFVALRRFAQPKANQDTTAWRGDAHFLPLCVIIRAHPSGHRAALVSPGNRRPTPAFIRT
jgi:hypothetical protein